MAGELALHDPAVRGSRADAERLFDPEFTEVGQSGRRWTRDEMLADMPEMAVSDPEGPRIEAYGMKGVLLGPGLVHVTYETGIDGRRARRSSLWRRLPESPLWRLYYHQGTPVPDGLR
ncbi:DUF4440 domain-containing protein [Streptomyces sp. MUM 203J]|uniref:nuclear transport factor 2 family protein n=1 Tax=Streptomyces sp. MUM 203J TaxID=2791990 RepID=UPI0027E4B495|nr:DUF4440 domain-containing protein [Streptomyces sp. MUM 203J]